jgi:hypothetical protein
MDVSRRTDKNDRFKYFVGGLCALTVIGQICLGTRQAFYPSLSALGVVILAGLVIVRPRSALVIALSIGLMIVTALLFMLDMRNPLAT